MTQILKPTAISDAMIEAGRKNTFIVEGRIDVAAIYTAMESARDDPDELREALVDPDVDEKQARHRLAMLSTYSDGAFICMEPPIREAIQLALTALSRNVGDVR